MSNDLWTPASARQKENVQARYRAWAQGQWAVFDHWNKVLKSIDPKLMLVRAQDNAVHPALKPGYYHVVKDNGPNRAPDIMVHQGPNGEFMEPNSIMLENLKKWDTHSNRSMYEARKYREQLEREREAHLKAEKEARIEDALDRFRHKYITKISVPGV